MSGADRKKRLEPLPASTQRRTQAERTLVTRKLILDTTIRHLARRGASGLRTADVAKDAGLSVGALLHHFPTKDDLIHAAFDQVNDRAVEMTIQRVMFARRAQSVRSVVDAIVADNSDFFFGHGFFIELALAFSKSDPTLRKAVVRSSRKARFLIEAHWHKALCEKGVPENVASDLLALTLSIVRGFAMRRFIDDDAARRAGLFRTWNEMIHAYLVARLDTAEVEMIYGSVVPSSNSDLGAVATHPRFRQTQKQKDARRDKRSS